ncbi:MAG: nuclease-related domain-containing protein [Kiritimatiellae bacterium]|nr:nuclease-related domain-containing protein [Kiritimatiellia bacterium]
MILKERNAAEHPETDKWSKAGATAEEQMAFYLRRMFVNDKDIYVFNDLRYKNATGDSAQIDHLILHHHGFIIVESKSVSSGVAVNKHGEWVRFWNGKPHGMPSPIQQAKLQAEFLRRELTESCKQLVGKVLLGLIQVRFNNCPFEILVAISDHGSIKREGKMPEVMKADQVPDKIVEIFNRHKKASSIFNIEKPKNENDGLYNFTDEEMNKITSFLLKYHRTGLSEKQVSEPQTTKVAEADPDWKYKPKPTTPPPLPKSDNRMGICDKCGEQCIIKWGKFSYYWKCLKCGNNMALKEYCPSCKKKLMLRKRKNEYFIFCETCGGERPYYSE